MDNLNQTNGFSVQNISGLWIIGLSILLLAGAISILPEEVVRELISENGPVETISALLYLVAAGVLLKMWSTTRRGAILSSSCVSLLLGLRELDFHSRFTTMGIFKTKFYVSSTVPIMEKMIVTAIVLTLLYCLIRYLANNRTIFFAHLKQRKTWALAVAAAIFCIITSKVLDGNSEPFQHLLFWHQAPELFIWTLEEVMEMAIPAFILVAAFSYRNEFCNKKAMDLIS